MEEKELIIIGAGPAGLSASINAAYFGINTLIFEENIPGGLAAEIPMLENYPGFGKGISGKSLIERTVEQCNKFSGEIRQFEKVVKLDFNKAYSPWCAYSKNYACPFTPSENCLNTPIYAGEKNYP